MKTASQTEGWRGKIGKMSEEEIAGFLAGNPFCRLGCLDEEGWPYVVPCWFAHSEGGFYIVPRARSAWAHYIQRDPRVFLCIDDTTIYNRRVLVKGEATIVEEPNRPGDLAYNLLLPTRFPDSELLLRPVVAMPEIEQVQASFVNRAFGNKDAGNKSTMLVFGDSFAPPLARLLARQYDTVYLRPPVVDAGTIGQLKPRVVLFETVARHASRLLVPIANTAGACPR